MRDTTPIGKAIRYITNIRDENFAVLNNFKKEIEAKKNSKISYNTLIYDNRLENCNTILAALEKQTTKKIEFDNNDLNICPVCKEHVRTEHNYCSNCGQKIEL